MRTATTTCHDSAARRARGRAIWCERAPAANSASSKGKKRGPGIVIQAEAPPPRPGGERGAEQAHQHAAPADDERGKQIEAEFKSQGPGLGDEQKLVQRQAAGRVGHEAGPVLAEDGQVDGAHEGLKPGRELGELAQAIALQDEQDEHHRGDRVVGGEDPQGAREIEPPRAGIGRVLVQDVGDEESRDHVEELDGDPAARQAVGRAGVGQHDADGQQQPEHAHGWSSPEPSIGPETSPSAFREAGEPWRAAGPPASPGPPPG